MFALSSPPCPFCLLGEKKALANAMYHSFCACVAFTFKFYMPFQMVFRLGKVVCEVQFHPENI